MPASAKIPNTGGALNGIVSRFGLNNPKRTVPVMKLIKAHKPVSFQELRNLINLHSEVDCICKIKSKGTVEDFGKKLYETQKQHLHIDKQFTLEQCITWMDDLFVYNSLKGETKELEAIRLLAEKFPTLKFERASGVLDEKIRIDIVASDDNKILLGKQDLRDPQGNPFPLGALGYRSSE
jgi:hypothetical protein